MVVTLLIIKISERNLLKQSLFICLVLILALKATYAEITFLDEPFQTVRDYLIQQNYYDAKDAVTQFLKEHPSDPTALYLFLAVEQTRILDYESYLIDGTQFIATADSIRAILEKKITTMRGSDSLMCLFYIANVYGGMGIMQAKSGSWFDGVKNAVTSVGMLKYVRKEMPQFYPAYLGIGVFDYYLKSSFKWLPFVDDDKCKDALQSINVALNAELPYSQAAKNTLCWILIDRKEFKKADSLASSVLNEFPDNTIFLRIKTLILYWTGDYKNAVKYASQLAILSQARNPVNWSDLVASYNVMVSGYFHLGMKKSSYLAAENILDKGVPLSYLSVAHIKKNMKNIKDLREKAIIQEYKAP
jgi:hypothetical protein